ncbi:MAG: hypothetical protein EZS28_029944 [Streblomastix strix]|uniref:Uncharacterized protein n=1 Tax=Streblomastix strix TaxID=222440 RepID=A0A5J4UX94_9EUKA|nr:MAG: hypothetical protein EZS28_029944 [Streblomastix strix]
MQDFILFLDNKMSNAYIYETLLDAEGLSKFPELYVYIHERESKRIVDGIANKIIVRSQYLQDYVNNNDDKLIVQPIPPVPITPFIPIAAEILKIQLT